MKNYKTLNSKFGVGMLEGSGQIFPFGSITSNFMVFSFMSTSDVSKRPT
jgi:hypothetical protein